MQKDPATHVRNLNVSKTIELTNAEGHPTKRVTIDAKGINIFDTVKKASQFIPWDKLAEAKLIPELPPYWNKTGMEKIPNGIYAACNNSGDSYLVVAHSSTSGRLANHLVQIADAGVELLSWNEEYKIYSTYSTVGEIDIEVSANKITLISTISNTDTSEEDIPAATTTTAGLMTATDKGKLDGMEDGLKKFIIDNELVYAHALNDLNNRLNNIQSLLNVTAADNGKILAVVNGQWQLVSLSEINS